MKFRTSVYEAIRQYNNLDENDSSMDKLIDAWPIDQVLDNYLSWEGIYGYTESILDIIEAFHGLEETNEEPNELEKILMDRDSMTLAEARELILDAKREMENYIAEGEIESATNICEEFFGLEPDYIDYLI